MKKRRSKRAKSNTKKQESVTPSLSIPRQTRLDRIIVRVKHVSAASWILGTSLLAAVGYVANVLVFRPEISIEPLSYSAKNPIIYARFKVTNQSVFSLYHLHYVVELWDGDKRNVSDDLIYPTVEMGELEELASHASYSVPVDSGPNIWYVHFNHPTMQIWITYSPLLTNAPKREEGYIFYALPNQNSEFQWLPYGKAKVHWPTVYW